MSAGKSIDFPIAETGASQKPLRSGRHHDTITHVKGLSYPKLSRTPEHAAHVRGLAPKHATFFGAW